MDIDVFEQLMAQKEKALGEINILDKGFDSVYHKVSPYLEQDKQSYRSAILEMQNLIRVITDCGVKIEGLGTQKSGSVSTVSVETAPRDW